MLSRTANAIYWIARYLERAENAARFIDVNCNLSLDLPPWTPPQWLPLVMTTGDDRWFMKKYKQANEENVVSFLLFDAEYGNSVISCIERVRELALTVREVFSLEIFEAINSFHLQLKSARKQARKEATDRWLGETRRFSHHLSGCMNATMTHDEAWHFFQLGAYLERAEKTSRIIDVKYFYLLPSPEYVDSALDNLHYYSLLNSTSGLEMYLRKWGLVNPLNVIDFLILERSFPRAVLFCVLRAMESLQAITGMPGMSSPNQAEQRLGLIHDDLNSAKADAIIAKGLHEFIDHLQLAINDVHSSIHGCFFDIPLPEGTDGTRPAEPRDSAH